MHELSSIPLCSVNEPLSSWLKYIGRILCSQWIVFAIALNQERRARSRILCAKATLKFFIQNGGGRDRKALRR